MTSDPLAHLAMRVAELERSFQGMMRHGTVEEVDTKKQQVRLKLGDDDDGKPFLSPWVPYGQTAGAYKFHNPPSKGQQMTLLSPTGDWPQSVTMPMTWSNNNKSPSEKEDEHVLTFGQWRIELKENSLILECGGTKWTLSDKGLKQNGGGIEHDGKLIDKTHKHTEVVAGPDLTGVPDAGSI